MADTRGLMACSKCGAFPDFHNRMSDITMTEEVKLRCPHCGHAVMERNYEEAAIAWNHYFGGKKEENEMKDILELVGKIEELLKKSKFEWFMTYDPKEKAWTFQVKEK